MAGSYVLPQVRVFQEFDETPNDVTQNLNPFVIGVNYHLMRYAESDERGDCTHKAYAGTALDLTWSKIPTGSTPDTSWYSVTFADVYAKMGSKNAKCLDAETGKYGTQFEFTLAEGESLTDDGGTAVFGTPVKAGDYLKYTEDTETKYAKIKSIGIGTPQTGEASHTLKKTGTSTDFSGLDVDYSAYTGGSDVTVYLDITVGSTNKVSWTTTHSGMPGKTDQTLTTSAYLDLGLGLKIKALAGLATGKATLTLKLGSTYVRDTVTLYDIVKVSSTSMTFDFVRHIDSADIDSTYLTASSEKVAVAADVAVKESGVSMTVVKAEAYLNQRNLLTTHTDGVYSLTSDTDIIRELGAITPDNPLAYGAHVMLLNCATASIKYIALESDTVEGWATALGRASVTTDVYAFCPLTEDKTTIESVVSHCNSLSTAEEKSWRIAFFSLPTDRDTDVTPMNGKLKEQCTVATASGVTTLTCRPRGGTTSQISAYSKFTSTVKVGDTVKVINTKSVEVTTTVKSIDSDQTLTLDDTVADASASLCNFTIIHSMGKAEYVDAIAATSTSFNSRRAYNVWPNSLKNSDGTSVSGMYAAAAVCALACSVAPQQPITNVSINGFSDIPDTYSTYNRDELNTIAAGGTLIVMQEKKGGEVYVRHQISTAYSSGNVNTTELSLTKNLDSISYYFANRFAPYIGRYNVTDDLLTELEGILKDGLAHLETATETNRLVGPQVLVDGTEIRSLYTSDEKDKVYASVSLNLPAPFNNFDLHLQVI